MILHSKHILCAGIYFFLSDAVFSNPDFHKRENKNTVPFAEINTAVTL